MHLNITMKKKALNPSIEKGSTLTFEERCFLRS